MNTRTLVGLIGLLSLLSGIRQVTGQGTAFTYQGRLTAGGNAAQGIYDFRFAIYDAESGGNALGGPLTNSAVTVSNGLFTAVLDFGVGIFAGDSRWLAIGVRTNGGAAFSTLAGRQPVSPSPYAIHAADAVTASSATTATTVPWGGLSGIPAGFADAVDNDTTYTAGTGLTLAGTVFSASFGGSGAAATVSRSDHNHAAGDVVSGTLADARLSTNVALLNGGPTFAGTLTAGGDLQGARLKVGSGHTLTGSQSTIAGGWQSTNAASWAAIGGGSYNTIQTGADNSTVGGGWKNTIQVAADYATIGGGAINTIQAETFSATISGGKQNTIETNAYYVTIGGGFYNTIRTNAGYATIGGGSLNTILLEADYATIPGGRENTAASYAFASGRRAKAWHPGAFVWADSTDADFGTTGTNQFLIRASGGVGIGLSNPQSALHVGGTVTASSFNGSAAGLTSLNADNLTAGTVPSARLSGTYANALTLNNAANNFGGSGAGLTSLNATSLASGTVADARLSANVALRSGGNAFTGNQSLTSGSLGIGITSPQSPLHIHQASGNSSIRLTSGTSWPLTINQSATSICIISNVNKPVLTMNGANVGIGTATPSAAGVAASVQVDGGYNQNSGFSIMETNGGRWALFFRGWESDNLIVRDERVSRDTMTFESGTGRVGIGTSTPATALEVADRITAGKVDGTFVNWTPGGGSVSVKRLICGSDPHAGYGVATGTDHASPIVWMYSQPGNRFEVMGMEYGQSIPSVYTRLMRVEINGDTYIARDVHVGRDAYASVFIPTSDRNLKTNVTPVDVQHVLSGVLALPISTWDFTNSPGTRHLGPMAQDFHAAFGLGADDRHITTVDADGVALAAIQGLNQKLEEALKHRDAENAELRRRLERLEQLLAAKNGGAQ